MRRRTTSRPAPGAQAARLTLILAVLAQACTSPAAVRRYSASAGLVTGKVPAANTAISASCLRAQSYRLRRGSDPWYATDSARAACADRDRALRDVARVNRVLAGYFAALGTLAGEKLPDARREVSALGRAVDDASDFDSRKLAAVTGLARFTAAQASDGYRREKLREAIAGQNENVQAVTTMLYEVLDRDFLTYLQADDNAETSFYRSAVTEGAAREPLGAILVRDSYDARHSELLERREAVRALGQAMLSVGRGHQRLYDSRDHLGGKELLASVVATARELETAIVKMDKAFGGQR